MPAAIATALYVGFILWLLWRSAQNGPRPSFGLWIATVWIGIMLSRPVIYWFGGGSASEEDVQAALQGNAIDRSILIILICAGVVVLLRRRVDWAAVVGGYAVVWMFYAFALISVAWSPYPLVSLKRLIRELGSVVMILIILTEAQSVEALRRAFLRCVVVLVPLSVLFIKYFPEIGRYYHRWTYQVQFSGVTTNKNSLGVLAMIGALFLVWHLCDAGSGSTRWKRLVSLWPEVCVLGMCLWILRIANSATALACCVLGLALFIAGRTYLKGASVKSTVGLVSLVGLTGWMALLVSDLRGIVAQSVGRDATLTTRTEIWEAALGLPTNPIFGAGFASVWLTPEGWALRAQIGGLAHAHNGYLETYLNGGLVGVALLLAALALAGIQAARHLSARTPSGAIFVALVVAGMAYNFSEVTFSNGNAVGLLLWLIALSNPAIALVEPAQAIYPDRRSAGRWKRPGRVRQSRAATKPRIQRFRSGVPAALEGGLMK
jgi:O-antigen ligase